MNPYMKHDPRIVLSLRNFQGMYGTGAKNFSHATKAANSTTPRTIIRII
jgi:hypothetical protein